MSFSHNANGAVISQSATVPASPVIESEPVDSLLVPGGVARFTVVASGPAPISYQWRHNGNPISGQTSDTLAISGLATNLTNYGQYTVVVTNPHGSVPSAAATVRPDTNRNGMPDAWELQHFGNLTEARDGDWDNDRISNYDEYLLGSSPSSTSYVLASAGSWYYHDLGATTSWTQNRILGETLQFQVLAAGEATNFTATNLPPGLTMNATTGLISGAPRASGQFTIALGAATIYGGATGTLQLTVSEVVGWGYNGSGQAAPPLGLTGVVALAAGEDHSLALRSNGTVTGWGQNYSSQLAIPSNLTTAVAIAAGDYHSLALKNDGTVVHWGSNSYSVGTVPAVIQGQTRAIAAGSYFSLALKADGTVTGWGNNSSGQTSVPPTLNTVTAIAAGESHVLALRADGTVVAWGDNSSGQSTVPPALSQVVAIAAGNDHSLALKSDGSVVAWGTNWSGESTVPPGAQSGVVAITAGGAHSVAIKADGSAVAWGYNWNGQLDFPAGDYDLAIVAGGEEHSLALATMIPGAVAPVIHSPWFAVGSVGIGFNYRVAATSGPTSFAASGLPDGLTIHPTTGIISGIPQAAGSHTVTISAGNAQGTTQRQLIMGINLPLPLVSAVTPAPGQPCLAGNPFSYAMHARNGPVTYSASGLPAGLQIGAQTGVIGGSSQQVGSFTVTVTATNPHGSATYSFTLDVPTVVGWGDTAYGATTPPVGLSGVIDLAASGNHSLALRANGTVACWGSAENDLQIIPAAATGVVAIAAGRYHNVVLKGDGTVVAWGYNGSGQCNVPPGLTGVAAIAAGDTHTLALKRDGTVVAWGSNSDGQSAVPPGLNTVVAIAASYYHSVALKGDGTVVAWGYNGYGQTSVPEDLGPVVAIAAGTANTMARRPDGSLVVWGYSDYDVTTVPETVVDPVEFHSGDGSCVVLNADGSVISWGYDSEGLRARPSWLLSASDVAAGYVHHLAMSPLEGGTGAPVILSPAFALGQKDRPFYLRVRSKNAATSYAASGLPAGLSIHPQTGLVSGSPEVGGTFAVTLSATNASGTVQRALSLTINRPAPLIAPPELPLEFTLGNAVSYHVFASNSPTSFTATGLPAGLSIHPQTGEIIGSTQLTGDFTITVSATNADGTGVATLVIRIHEVAAWGNGLDGQTIIPPGLTGVVAVAAGNFHSLALRSDGTVTGWGYNGDGQTATPAGLGGVVAIAAGERHSLALRHDGTVVAWGENSYGQATIPPGLTGVIAIAAHGAHSLALKSDGTVTGWGSNDWGQLDIPPGLANVVAIATADYHSLALRANGTVVGWGNDYWGQATPPEGLTGVKAISTGSAHNLALKTNGTVVAWGHDDYGQSTIPESLAAGGVKAIAAGGIFSLALMQDDTVVGWGDNSYGQLSGVGRLSVMSAGNFHTVAIGAFLPTVPELVTPATVSGVRGRPFHFQISSRHRATSFSVTGLPPGLSVNPQTGLISGVLPAGIGTIPVTLSATNATGTGQAPLQIVVRHPDLVLVGAVPGVGEVGIPYGYTIPTQLPASNFSATNLPPGLTIDPSTGAITGTPTASGTFIVNLQADTTDGPSIARWVVGIRPAFNASVSQDALTFTRGGASSWFIQSAYVPPGQTVAARSGPIGDSAMTWFETTVQAPGTVKFRRKVSSESGYDHLKFIVNGTTTLGTWNGEQDWNLETYSITGTGARTLRWQYSTDSGTKSGLDAAFVADIDYTPVLVITNTTAARGELGLVFTYQLQTQIPATDFSATGLPPGLSLHPSTGVISGTPSATGSFTPQIQATTQYGVSSTTWPIVIVLPFNSGLSPSGLTFTHGGNVPWEIQTAQLPPGITPAARSGIIGHGGSSWIEATITRPGVVAYWRKVSSEGNYDYLRVYQNNNNIASWSGNQDWARQTITLAGSGPWTIRWQYSKDGSGVSGLDAAFLAGVTFTPAGRYATWPVLAFLSPDRRGENHTNGPLGLENLLSYALGLYPPAALPENLPAAAVETHAGARHLVFTFAKNPDAGDISYIPEITTHLATGGWNSGTAHFDIIENTETMMKVRAKTPLANSPRQFVRLRVERINE